MVSPSSAKGAPPSSAAKHKDIFIFDTDAIRQHKNRAASTFREADFLFDWSGRQILDRLADVKRDYDKTLVMGLRQSKDFFETLSSQPQIKDIIAMEHADQYWNTLPHNSPAVQAYEEILPFAEKSLDLIIGNLCFHSLNDLPGTLVQIRRILKDDGLFMGSMFGGETLTELRQCLIEAEMEVSGGISPRISPFADKQDMGALMQRAGYALPVIDSERLTVTYENAFKLFTDLRHMGETNTLHQRIKHISPRRLFFRAAEIYAEKFAESDGRIIASFDIIFLLGWAPHESQQKPLKPGSAQNRLSDALGTTEIKT